jgi:hypothetical protein
VQISDDPDDWYDCQNRRKWLNQGASMFLSIAFSVNKAGENACTMVLRFTLRLLGWLPCATRNLLPERIFPFWTPAMGFPHGESPPTGFKGRAADDLAISWNWHYFFPSIHHLGCGLGLKQWKWFGLSSGVWLT